MSHDKWFLPVVGLLALCTVLYLTQCHKPTVDPAKVVSVDSGASSEVGIPDAATLADAVSPADVASPVTP